MADTDGKRWISERRLQRFWNGIKSRFTSMHEEVEGVKTFVHEEIGNYVSDWLDEHIDPAETPVVIDDSLTISGAAADAAKCGELKNVFMRLENTKNLFIDAPLVENKYYYAQPSGATTKYSYFAVNVESGKSYIFNCSVRFIGKEGTGISNTELLAGTPYSPEATELEYFTVFNSERAKWAMCESTVDINTVGTYYTPTLSDSILKQETGNGKAQVMSQKATTDAINEVNDVASEADAKIAQFIDFLDIEYSPNLLDLDSANVARLLLNDGNLSAAGYPNYITTDYIPISAGETLRYQFTYNGRRYDNSTVPGYTNMARICAYDSSFMYIPETYTTQSTAYTAPNNTAFVRVSLDISGDLFSDRALIISSSAVVLPFSEYGTIIGSVIGDIDDKVDALANEQKESYYKDNFYQYKGAYTGEIDFTELTTSAKSMILNTLVNFTAFTDVTIGIKNATDVLYYVKVDSTKIYVYDYVYGSGRTTEFIHGLTIANNVGISAVMDNTGVVSITITSAGENYTTPNNVSVTRAALGYPYFTFTGTASWVNFSATVANIDKDIWIFGDSYVSDSTSRWAYYLNRNGNNNIMLDGYGGEGSIPAYTSFLSLSAMRTPKYIVWCLGMNDGSSYDRWFTYVSNLISYCEAHLVTLVLTTIPSIPTINHENKNDYVRSSGYKYIDFAKAVGATSSGEWFVGMLSDDNVHPSDKGAKALYQEAITAFPQLIMK